MSGDPQNADRPSALPPLGPTRVLRVRRKPLRVPIDVVVRRSAIDDLAPEAAEAAPAVVLPPAPAAPRVSRPSLPPPPPPSAVDDTIEELDVDADPDEAEAPPEVAEAAAGEPGTPSEPTETELAFDVHDTELDPSTLDAAPTSATVPDTALADEASDVDGAETDVDEILEYEEMAAAPPRRPSAPPPPAPTVSPVVAAAPPPAAASAPEEASRAPESDDEIELEEMDGAEIVEASAAKKKPVEAAPKPPKPPAETAAKPPKPPEGAPASPPAAPAGAFAKKRQRPWYEDFFSDDYLRTVRTPSPKEIARECDFIEKTLGFQPGATILDVGCGLGLHAIELTKRGYLVVGLDLSLPMLSRAADEAKDHGMRINFLHGDMREMSFEGAFDAVLCWGTTFGYFDDEGNRKVLQRFISALRPGGFLLLDVANRDFVIRSQPNLVWFEGDGCICMEETKFNSLSSRLEVSRNVILDDGKQRDNAYTIRLYSLHELGHMLHQSKFKVLQVSGLIATPGVYFGADSPRIVLLAERKAEGPVSIEEGRPTGAAPAAEVPLEDRTTLPGDPANGAG